MRRNHYFSIWTDSGYVGEYDTEEDAEHDRRRLYGIRAIAHPIVKVSAKWNQKSAAKREP